MEEVLKKDDKVQPFLTTVASLTSQTDNWIIHAKVVEKTEVKRWDLSRTSGQLFHIVLEDHTGAIRATIFDSAVEKLYYFFEVGKFYAVSNGKVRRKPDYSFEMTITDSSIVTPLTSPPTASTTTIISQTTENYPIPTSPTPIRSILKTLHRFLMTKISSQRLIEQVTLILNQF